MPKKIQVLADENIPMLARLLGDKATITYKHGRSISADDLVGVDALFIRSITTVNLDLLLGSSVRFVGSCTIGTDHVDLEYLHSIDLPFANAPGCNASAVVDYVLTAMLDHEPSVDLWREKQVGLIGCGQVGSRLRKRLAALDIPVRCYDPFVDEACDSLDAVLASDCVTLHVPLVKSGEYPTVRMIGEDQLRQLLPDSLLINTSRGRVVSQEALMAFLEAGDRSVVLDVFEGEPAPSHELLSLLKQATPHIAGYSEQGKIRGTLQVVDAFFDVFGLPPSHDDILAETFSEQDASAGVLSVLERTFSINELTNTFRKAYLACVDDTQRAACFDHLRKTYPLRKEWEYTRLRQINHGEGALLDALGFSHVR